MEWEVEKKNVLDIQGEKKAHKKREEKIDKSVYAIVYESLFSILFILILNFGWDVISDVPRPLVS